MNRLFKSLSKGVFIFVVMGGLLMYFSADMVITSLKPEHDFVELMEEEAEEGMHIKGEVQYVFDCFAYEETWRESSRYDFSTAAETSHYYYIIPGNGDKYMGLEVLVDGKEDMDKLSEETYRYLSGGEAPVTKITVEGRITRMDDEMSALFKEYLQEMGYADNEIASMGEFFYVQQPASMRTVQGLFGAGALLVLIGILIFIKNFKRNRNW